MQIARPNFNRPHERVVKCGISADRCGADGDRVRRLADEESERRLHDELPPARATTTRFTNYFCD